MAQINALPRKVALTNNKAEAVTLPMPGNNTYFTIPAGDTLIFDCKTSQEVLAFITFTKNDKGLELADVED